MPANNSCHTVIIGTKDSHVWNPESVYAEIVHGMSQDLNLTLDFNAEAPCLVELGFYDFLTYWANKLNYDQSRITIFTANCLEWHDKIKIKKQSMIHLKNHALDYISHVPIDKKDLSYHFGMFIGRSNAPRLHLASHLYHGHGHKSLMKYHFNCSDDFHRYNIGLDDLVKNYNLQDTSDESRFLSQCPFGTQGIFNKVDKSKFLGFSYQLLQEEQNPLWFDYQKFFVEIACESYFTGNTFFLTEKTFRPMLLKTPFIVQGPRFFLTHLKKLGFQTFEKWWDEGYQEDPYDHQLTEIIRVINSISAYQVHDLLEMYHDMQPVLDHNYHRLLELKEEDFELVFQ